MKKTILSVILMLLCVIMCLSGCGLGSYIESGDGSGSNSGNNRPGETGDPENPDGPGEIEDTSTHYTVTVYLGTEPFSPGSDIVTAVWKSDYDIHRIELNSNGFADAGELDGDYSVYLEGLPSKYAYNANINIATSEQRAVAIALTTIMSPERGSGDGRGDLYNHIILRYNGTYRAELNSEYDVIQYVYKPTSAGFYSIESWVNVYEDEVNPYIDIYNGHENFKLFSRTMDGGGASLTGGYTKNFRYEVRVDATEVGSSFCFAIHASSKMGNYPAVVDFAIAFEGDYVSSNSDVRIIRATEANFKASEPLMGQQFVFADFGTKIFENKNFKYSESTGRYHYYSMELFGDNPYGYGAGYGPVLMCAINKVIPSYTLSTLYTADTTGVGVSFNYLKLYNVWIEEEQKFAVYDYTDFIKQDYYNVCNTDGVCYVTKELKDFLQKFAENHSLYTDHVGPGEGMPEYYGYSANQDALWLFACGVYMYPN